MKRQGFTLIELLIVIAIIGIVAAIAIPNLLTALQKGKQKATMGDMKSIGNAIESYMTDLYMAPADATDATELEVYLAPFYMKVMPKQDGWGGPYMYISQGPGDNQDLYSVWSYGRGSAINGGTVDVDPTNSPYVVSSMTGFQNDIVFSNGNFTFAPKVK
jgi:general secretion pathway protein G